MFFIFGYDSDNPIDLKNVTVTFQDGAANSIEVTFDEGNFVWNEAQERQYVLNRGKAGKANGGAVRNGDDTPMQITINARFSFYYSSTDKKPLQFLKNTDDDLTSTDSDSCAPFAVDILLENTPECSTDETLAFRDFRWETGDFDVRAGTCNITGRCNSTEPEVV